MDCINLKPTTKRRPPLLAIRAKCLECSETSADVRGCACSSPIETPVTANGGYYCSLYPYRMGHLPAEGPRRPLKAIRAYCLWCGDGSAAEVQRCHPLDCPLREFRFGKNPELAGKRPLTEEQRKALIDRLAKINANRGSDQDRPANPKNAV